MYSLFRGKDIVCRSTRWMLRQTTPRPLSQVRQVGTSRGRSQPVVERMGARSQGPVRAEFGLASCFCDSLESHKPRVRNLHGQVYSPLRQVSPFLSFVCVQSKPALTGPGTRADWAQTGGLPRRAASREQAAEGAAYEAAAGWEPAPHQASYTFSPDTYVDLMVIAKSDLLK